jgi:hypothetical protein
MHFCTAHVAIGGDPRNIMYRDEFSPVSWPELEVLRVIHGDDAVTGITVFADVRQTARAERERLAMKYSDEPLAEIWGGRNAPTELNAAGIKLKEDIIWMNPLSGQMEKTTAKGSEPYTPPPETRSAAEIVGQYAVRDAATEAESGIYSEEPEEESAPVEEEEDPTKEIGPRKIMKK